LSIQLPQHYNFTAMNGIRVHLNKLCGALSTDADLAARRIAAVDKLIDLELAIILRTYSEDMIDQLRKRERLATFGQMTSSIAHELRNPLGVIDSSAFLLRRRVGDDPATLGHVDKIRTQVSRSNRIITNLLNIVRDKPPSRLRVPASQVAERAVAGLRDERGADAELQMEAAMPDVSIDAEQMQQVLSNLLINAADAAGPDGKVRLRVGRRERHVEFVVSDSGAGIDPSLGGRLFEPLVTTKATGVGLGLALCRKVVAAHPGAVIELATTRDPRDLPGANFSLRLQVAD
jgi:signal transduction histidine kinase